MKRKIKAQTEKAITADIAFDEFIQEKELHNASKSTLRNYKLTYSIFYRYNEFDSDTEITEINQNLLNKWLNHLKKEELTPPTINHYIRDIRVFINWCKKREYLPDKLEIKELRKQEGLPKNYPDEDLERLLAKPDKQDSFTEWRTWAIINTVLGTGTRAQSILNLTVSDIDFTNRQINFSNHTKNREAQIVPMSQGLFNALKEYIGKWDLTGYLFPNVGDEQLSSSGLRSSYVRYCAKREVEETSIHALRHTFAKNWITSGGNQFQLQRIMGHKTLTMTSHYVKLYSQDLKQGYEDHSLLDRLKKKTSRTSNFKKGN